MKIIVTLLAMYLIYKVVTKLILPSIIARFLSKQKELLEDAIKKQYGIEPQEPDEYTPYEEIKSKELD